MSKYLATYRSRIAIIRDPPTSVAFFTTSFCSFNTTSWSHPTFFYIVICMHPSHSISICFHPSILSGYEPGCTLNHTHHLLKPFSGHFHKISLNKPNNEKRHPRIPSRPSRFLFGQKIHHHSENSFSLFLNLSPLLSIYFPSSDHVRKHVDHYQIRLWKTQGLWKLRSLVY